MKRIGMALVVLALGAIAYLVAFEISFRMLGNRDVDDEPGGGWQW